MTSPRNFKYPMRANLSIDVDLSPIAMEYMIYQTWNSGWIASDLQRIAKLLHDDWMDYWQKFIVELIFNLSCEYENKTIGILLFIIIYNIDYCW